MSNGRDVYLILNVMVDRFSYSINVSVCLMKCFGCGQTGHWVRACLEKRDGPTTSNKMGSDQKTEEGQPPDTSVSANGEGVTEGNQTEGEGAMPLPEATLPLPTTEIAQDVLTEVKLMKQLYLKMQRFAVKLLLMKSKKFDTDCSVSCRMHLSEYASRSYKIDDKFKNRFMHSLKSESGVLLTSDHEIQNRARKFCQDQYKSKLGYKGSNNLFLGDLLQVSMESFAELDVILALEEVERALQGIQSGKAPDLDGIKADFYECFWSERIWLLCSVIVIAGGHLPVRYHRVVLTFLHKRGNLTNIRCWRLQIFIKSLTQ